MINCLGIQYSLTDSSNRKLKEVVLYSGKLYGSIPNASFVHLKESYESINVLLENMNYVRHSWNVCEDLKIEGILLRQETGYTIMPCFMCEWDSCAKFTKVNKMAWKKTCKVHNLSLIHI